MLYNTQGFPLGERNNVTMNSKEHTSRTNKYSYMFGTALEMKVSLAFGSVREPSKINTGREIQFFLVDFTLTLDQIRQTTVVFVSLVASNMLRCLYHICS